MKNIKDKNGKILKQGDFVLVEIDHQFAVGVIAEKIIYRPNVSAYWVYTDNSENARPFAMAAEHTLIKLPEDKIKRDSKLMLLKLEGKLFDLIQYY